MSVNKDSIYNIVDEVVVKHNGDPSMLVAMLQDVQAQLYFLPRESIVRIAEKLDIPLTRVYSVATFFRAFSLKPRGKHNLKVCMGTACHVRGAEKVLDKIETELCVCAGETTKDMKYTIETANCVGACALGPVVVVDNEFVGQMTTDKVKTILEKCN
ncbi:NADH dehydrogenase (ubiquinone) 24 kDa subunit [Dehalogenimonas lykanthroporepellens BL-DC-9]|jgi:NADH-quinone oxidoreductase subunit E|nr:NADH dehydrogenase (ubiquinone) 24 kDa subunit [Dehalogenimonas lykanthroporepellens BL-DC-9]